MEKAYPHVPAAFINAIAEEGTKEEAVEFLQNLWNETCAIREELRFTQGALRRLSKEFVPIGGRHD